jgi:N utilization substance protein B
MAREKALQILAAIMAVEVELDVVFPHIFFRQFTFDPGNPEKGAQRILRPDEVHELDADVPITWAKREIDYAFMLVRQTQTDFEHLQGIIDAHAKHWALERIAYIDRVLLAMSIAEMTTSPDIPVKVTINEAIDLAKKYSTDKSGTFVNGILDAVNKTLTEQGKIHKTGRPS